MLTSEQRNVMTAHPVVRLFNEDGSTRKQALAPVYSCFPSWRNILDSESPESYQSTLRNDTTLRYHLHEDLVLVPQVNIYQHMYNSR
jgi:hypothetical protein